MTIGKRTKPKAADEAKREQLSTEQRILLASAFELAFVFLVCAISSMQTYSDLWRQGMSSLDGMSTDQVMLKLFTSTTFLISSALVFFEVFSIFLTARSIMVNLLVRLGGIPSKRTVLTFPEPMSAPSQRETPPLYVDEIEGRFERFIERNSENLKVAQRRPNTLLFVGTAIAFAGLAFFVATLPGFIAANEAAGTAPLTGVDLSRRLLDLTPRLLMLIFIQLLAGFFLRQYRNSMEELRYYEAVLRYRETQVLSYMMTRQATGDLSKFAYELLKERDFMKLKQGETTYVLEASKNEANEFKGVLDTIVDAVQVASPSRAVRGKASARKTNTKAEIA